MGSRYFSNFVWLACAALGCGWSASARAQFNKVHEPTRIGAYGAFGFAGEAEVDYDGPFFPDGEVDLLTTYGFGVVGEHALHRYFLIGARFAATWWNADRWDELGADRNVFLALSPQAKVRYPFDLGGAAAEVSFTVPLGLTVSLPDDDWPDDIDTGLGFNVAALGGFAVWLKGGVGLFTELGWQWHNVGHEFENSGLELDITTAQLALNVGVFTEL